MEEKTDYEILKDIKVLTATKSNDTELGTNIRKLIVDYYGIQTIGK